MGAEEKAIAIDGKALRGIHGDELPGFALWRHILTLDVLWWVKKGGGDCADKRESELSLAKNLLDSISVKGKIVTGDALYCQRRLCELIVSKGGDYLLLVKGNQKSLQEDIEFCFEGSTAFGTYRHAEAFDRHGDRWEHRRLCATDMLKGYLDWPGHAQVIKMESARLVKGKATRQVRYGITSLGYASVC